MTVRLTPVEPPLPAGADVREYETGDGRPAPVRCYLLLEQDGASRIAGFGGAFAGAAVSEKTGVIAVLTSDCLYLLDLAGKTLLDREKQPKYTDVTCTPLGDILLTDGYGIDVLRGRELFSLESVDLPINPDSLRFAGYEGGSILLECTEFLSWDHTIRMKMDCEYFK